MGKRLTLALAVFAAVAVLLGTYAAGYVCLGWLGESVDEFDRTYLIERVYTRPWLTTLFQPAGWFEQRCRGVEVQVLWEGELPIPQPPTLEDFDGTGSEA